MIPFFLILPVGLYIWLSITRYIAAVVLVAAFVPLYLLRFSLFDVPTNLLEVFIGVLLVVGLLHPCVRGHMAGVWREFDRKIVMFAALFLAACIVSVVVSPQLRVSLGILKGWVVMPMVFGWVVYVVRASHRESEERILQALIGSGVIVSLMGLSQAGYLDRIQSVYDVPNSLALFIAPLIGIAAWKALHVTQEKLFYSLAALVMLIALITTQSFMGFGAVVLVLTGAVIYWKSAYIFQYVTPGSTRSLDIPKESLDSGSVAGMTRKKKRGFGLSLLFVSTIIAIFLAYTGSRLDYLARPLFDYTYHNSISVRLQLWSIGWDLIKEHPFLGVGLGQFEPEYQQKLHERFAVYNQQSTPSGIREPLPEFVFRDPHNWLISFWLNTGILGLASFIGLHVLAIRQAAFKKHSINAQAVIVALGILLIFGLADTVYWKNDLAVLQWILLVLLL